MKTLLVGEAPPRSRLKDSPTSLPFSGSSGRRLSELLGVEVTQAFETYNLLSYWPGAAAHGSRFPMPEAKKAAIALIRRTSPNRRIVLVGTRVAKALRMSYLPLLEWRQVRFKFTGGDRIVWVSKIPHPSGTNQQWNDPETAEKVKAFLLDEIRSSHA